MIAPLQNADCLFLSGENPAKVGYVALAVVEADKLIPLSKDFLASGYHLEDVSGLVTSDGAVSVYHFDHFDIPGRATVLVIAPLDAPSFPSIADVYQCAEWHERETRDFFGFQYEGNPNFIPLLLSEDMVDVHPLLKDEGSLASLASMFSSEGREREIVKQADGFTLLDAPVAEEPAPAEAPAVQADAAPAPKAEAPKAEPAPEAPKAEAAPEAPKVEEAPKSEPAPASEAPKEAAKSAPAAEKKETPEPQAEAPVTPEAKPESEPKPVPESKPEPRKAAPKDEAKAAPKKVQGTVKKGKVVKSGKKGAGNA